jgi:hypothetical protein
MYDSMGPMLHNHDWLPAREHSIRHSEFQAIVELYLASEGQQMTKQTWTAKHPGNSVLPLLRAVKPQTRQAMSCACQGERKPGFWLIDWFQQRGHA